MKEETEDGMRKDKNVRQEKEEKMRKWSPDQSDQLFCSPTSVIPLLAATLSIYTASTDLLCISPQHEDNYSIL
jgi:hypothetical protein